MTVLTCTRHLSDTPKYFTLPNNSLIAAFIFYIFLTYKRQSMLIAIHLTALIYIETVRFLDTNKLNYFLNAYRSVTHYGHPVRLAYWTIKNRMAILRARSRSQYTDEEVLFRRFYCKSYIL